MSDQNESPQEVTDSQSAELPEIESIRVTEPREGLPEIVSNPEQLANLVAAISGEAVQLHLMPSGHLDSNTVSGLT